MLQKTREQIGTAGLIVAIAALVAALGGGAYAASGGLTGKQKKEVKKIAKVEAKKYAKQGKRGPAGKNGQNGVNGANGAPGVKGATGARGEGVTIKPYLGEECPTEEGTEFSNATGTSFACDGENGETGFTSTLPSGETEHGTWSVGPFPGASAAFETYVPLSLNIPLAQSELAVHYLTEEEGEDAPASAECPGSYEAPAAAKGNLCVYTTEEAGTTFKRPRNAEALTESTGRSGTLLRFGLASATSNAYGTWVVTAP